MKGKRPELKAVDGGLLKAPPMPDTLPKAMAVDWQEIAADLTGRGLLPQSALTVLETYIVSLWMSRQCRKAIIEHGPLVRNSAGMLRPNPAAAMMAKAADTCARLAYEMGLSAAGRNLPAMKSPVKSANDSADPFADCDL